MKKIIYLVLWGFYSLNVIALDCTDFNYKLKLEPKYNILDAIVDSNENHVICFTEEKKDNINDEIFGYCGTESIAPLAFSAAKRNQQMVTVLLSFGAEVTKKTFLDILNYGPRCLDKPKEKYPPFRLVLQQLADHSSLSFFDAFSLIKEFPYEERIIKTLLINSLKN